MLFAVHSLDRPGTAIRSELMAEHKSYLGRIAGQIASAGPLLDGGGGMIGSFLLVEFPCLADAEGFFRDEPFQKAGLYQTMSILQYRETWRRRPD